MIKFTHQNGIFLTLVIKQKLLGAYFYIRKYLEHDLFIHFIISGYPNIHTADSREYLVSQWQNMSKKLTAGSIPVSCLPRMSGQLAAENA